MENLFATLKKVVTNGLNSLGINSTTPTLKKFVYLSWCQPNPIDWATLKASGVIVGIRTGQGIWEDELFKSHYANVIKYGIPFILWHFWQPDMTSAPQVTFLLGLVNKLPVKPKAIAWDFEPIEWWKKIDGVNVRQPDIVPISRDWSHKEILYALKETQKAGYKAGIYTRKNIFESWTYETSEWYQFWLWVAAWYIYTGTVKPALPWKWQYYLIHQYAGGTPNALPGIGSNSVCLEYWNTDAPVSIDEYFISSDNSEIPVEETMTLIHDKNVLQKDRAWVMGIRSNQKITITAKETGVDKFLLEAGYAKMVDGELLLAATDTFALRSKLYAPDVAIGAWFEIYPGAFVQADWTDKPFTLGIKENPVLKMFMDALHFGPWNWNDILTGKGVWNKFHSIVIKMEGKEGWPPGTPLGNDWVTRVFKQTVDHLFYLQDGGNLPIVPIILQADVKRDPNDAKYKSFLETYDSPSSEFAILLQNLQPRLYLILEQQVFDSTRIFNDISEVFLPGPSDSFGWDYLPANYFGKVLAHKFSGPQKISWFVDTDGNLANLDLYKWCTKAADMQKFLGFVPGEVVTPPNPPVPPVVDPTLTALQASVVQLTNQLDRVDTSQQVIVATLLKIAQIINENLK